MGAFGEGMRDNDTALDAIAEYTTYDDSNELVLRGPLPPVTEMFEGRTCTHAVLGLAEWLLDTGVDLTPVRQTIDLALEEERKQDVLVCWTDERARLAALDAFERRLKGEEPPTHTQRFLEFGSADDLDERIMGEDGRAHGGDPVAVCIRVNGETPEEAVANVRELLNSAMRGRNRPAVEEVSEGHVRIEVFADERTGEYINVYLNVNNLDAERDDVPDEAEEMEEDDADPEA